MILTSSQLAVPPSGRYRAAHDSGARKAGTIRHAILHCTGGPTAAGAAAWFTNPSSGGSTQLVVDDTIAYRTLPDLVVPWGAPPLNESGLHIEQAGFASWSKARWLFHVRTIQRAAWQTAKWCDTYAIPPVWLTVDQLKRTPIPSGITSHANITLAFGESDHTDPGPGYPVSTFLWFLGRYLKAV